MFKAFQVLLLFFSISADLHGLLAPEESPIKAEKTSSHILKTLLDITRPQNLLIHPKIFRNCISKRPRQPPKHNEHLFTIIYYLLKLLD